MAESPPGIVTGLGDVHANAMPVTEGCGGAVEKLHGSATAGTKVYLEPGLEIKDVEKVHEVLARTLARGRGVTVDVGRVVAVDTAGVQLLLAFQSEAVKRGMPTEFCGDSAALARALTVLGLGDKLHIALPRD
ncbi:MAG: lipid asymmetry maintenance protein MlaB [Steroidobacteraceae bacterium]